MDEQGYKFGVGVLVIALAGDRHHSRTLFLALRPTYSLGVTLSQIQFDSAPGVTTDTPVRRNGVQIGRVRSVQLQEGDEDGVNLTLELDSQYRVPASSLPRIGTGSIITGDAVVEFIRVADDSPSLIERFDGVGGSPVDGILDEREKSGLRCLHPRRRLFQGRKGRTETHWMQS